MRRTVQRISRLCLSLFALAGILACATLIPGTPTPVPPTITQTFTVPPTNTITPTVPPTPTNDLRITYPGNQHLYLYVLNNVSWHSARDYCASQGGHLVTIESAEENSFIFHLTDGNTWLGATDEVEEGTWVWVNGQAWTYTDWDDGEPNNSCPPRNCGGTAPSPEYYLSYSSHGTTWNDMPQSKMLFVCEWE